MTTDETNQQSPFTRPGFLIAAAFVVILIVVGIVLGVTAMNRDDSPQAVEPSTTDAVEGPATSAPPSDEETDTEGCQVPGETDTGSLTTAPEAVWEYQGTMAYPSSETFGPTETTDEGVRTCFQRSPEGALFAAANGAVQASDSQLIEPWLKYFLAEGPNRDAFLNAGPGGSGDTSGIRARIAGFRMLAFDGKTANVDVALQASTEGQTILMSSVYTLIWENGDWKLTMQDPSSPVDFATIPDLAGYTIWGE